MVSTVAQLAVKVSSNTDQAVNALTGLTTVMKATRFEALAMVGAVAGIAIIGGISLKMAADFQSGMVSLATGAGEATAAIRPGGLVYEGILKMAEATGTSTQQLISGLYMIESAGYHGAAGLAVLQAAAEGAKVGNADLGTVADAVTTVMKDYASTGIDAAHATNLLIATVANGKTHMEDLAGSIATVLPVASRFGVSLGDVMGGMATITSHGIAAANAATYLRQMIVSLEAPSGAGAKALASIGLTAQQVGDMIHQSLPEALADIQKRINETFGPGTAAAKNAFKEIAGGARQMQGMLQLTGPYMDEFQKKALAMGGAAFGASKGIVGWSLVQGTFNQHMDVLKEVLQTAMIELGQKLLPVATQFVGFLTGSAVPAIQNFITMIQGSSKEAQILRPILIAVGILIAGALTAAFVVWAGAAFLAAAGMIAASWEVLAIGAAIALLVVGIIYAYTHWGWFRAAVNAVVAALGWLKDQIGNVLGQIGQLDSWIRSHTEPELLRLGKVFENVTSPIQVMKLAVQGLLDFLGRVAGVAGGAIGALRNLGNVGSGVGNLLSHIPGFATGGTMPDTGIALVGEAGPEIVQLPGGSQVTPLSGGSIIQGPPNMMGLAGGAGSGSANGQPIQVNLYIDKTKIGMVLASALPPVVRNGTGTRRF